ncbi:MAG: porin family protein [Proteobacteria bacterium]|nr:porin family protein [Pseudomonadota bacterium]
MSWILTLTLIFVVSAAPAADGLPPLTDDAPPAPVVQGPDRSVLVSVEAQVFTQPSAAMKQVYGTNTPFAGGLRAAWLFGERFGVGGGASFALRKGTGVAPAGQTPPETWMTQVPIELEGSMRVLVFRTQPVVPYLRGGLTGVVWRESWADSAGKLAWIQGIKFGVHVGGGVQIRLPFPEINMRNRRIGDAVLDDIWLHVEGWARSANDFGRDGLDLSTAGAGVGLTFLM